MSQLEAVAVALAIWIFGTLSVVVFLAFVARIQARRIEQLYQAHRLTRAGCSCRACSTCRRWFAVTRQP